MSRVNNWNNNTSCTKASMSSFEYAIKAEQLILGLSLLLSIISIIINELRI